MTKSRESARGECRQGRPGRALPVVQPRVSHDASDSGRLARAKLDHERAAAAGASAARRRRSRDKAARAVHAAIERQTRIVIVARRSARLVDIARFDIGRIRNHEDRRDRARPPKNRRLQTSRARESLQIGRIGARGRERAGADDRCRCRTRSAIRAATRAGSRRTRCRDRRSAEHRFCGQARRRARPRRRFRFPAAAPACPPTAEMAGSRIPCMPENARDRFAA